MKILDKATAITVSLITIFTISLVAIPLANAQHNPGWDIVTFAYINVAPNPVGVGQKVDILIWVDKPRASASLFNDYRMHNYRLTITDSNGDEVLNKFWETVVDTTSSQYYAWTPDAAGTYTLTFDFEGFYAGDFPSATAESNDTYVPDSASVVLTVQEEPLPPPITSYPLPAEYWTRPIYGENTDWWSISSNWPGTGSPEITGWGFSAAGIDRDPGGGVGPETAHIMWANEVQMGGVVGGTNFPIPGNTWFEGSAYSQRYTNPIILAGRLYYNPPVSYTGSSSGPTTCVDLRTGKVIWARDDVPPPSFAYIYDVEDPQQHGVYPAMLVSAPGFLGPGSTWDIYDAWTGDWLVQIRNVPSGTWVLGPQGELINYVITPGNQGNTEDPDWRLRAWNSSLLWNGAGFALSSTGLSPAWDTETKTTTTWAWQNKTIYEDNVPKIISENVTTTTTATYVDASYLGGSHNRYSLDVPLTWLNDLPQSVSMFGTLNNPATPIFGFYSDTMIFRQGNLPGLTPAGFGVNSQSPYTYYGINLNSSKGTVGAKLWSKTYGPPAGNVSVVQGVADPVTRVFTESYKETTQHVGYSMDDGSRLWTTQGQAALDYYGNPSIPWISSLTAYGNLYSSGYGGIIYCYDMKTGELKWTYGNGGEGNSTNSGFQLAYGHYPTFIGAFGSGMVYSFTAEHTVNTPIYKGALARGINATTGEEVWTLSDYDGSFFAISYAIADGFATFYNGYDNRIYVVGRGPSATTVTAPDAGLAFGQSVMIKGTVMDVSSGLGLNDEIVARFTNGVPAVSDESMTDWMGYLWQQRPFPSDCSGVPVTIDVMDSNNNYRTIGTATTDASGVFNFEWTPDIPGKFTVIATFEGTNGYWPSYSETAFTVMNPPEATPPPTAPPASNTDAYVTGFGIGIIIVIVVVGLAIIIMLRRR
jgi:outer membrane protein assembly factor BamB